MRLVTVNPGSRARAAVFAAAVVLALTAFAAPAFAWTVNYRSPWTVEIARESADGTATAEVLVYVTSANFTTNEWATGSWDDTGTGKHFPGTPAVTMTVDGLTRSFFYNNTTNSVLLIVAPDGKHTAYTGAYQGVYLMNPYTGGTWVGAGSSGSNAYFPVNLATTGTVNIGTAPVVDTSTTVRASRVTTWSVTLENNTWHVLVPESLPASATRVAAQVLYNYRGGVDVPDGSVWDAADFAGGSCVLDSTLASAGVEFWAPMRPVTLGDAFTDPLEPLDDGARVDQGMRLQVLQVQVVGADGHTIEARYYAGHYQDPVKTVSLAPSSTVIADWLTPAAMGPGEAQWIVALLSSLPGFVMGGRFALRVV